MKTLWEKEKMLVTSIFSFSHNVFKRPICQGQRSRDFVVNDPRKKPFDNIVGKAENVGNHHFLLFPQYFLSFAKQMSVFDSHLNSSLIFCRLVKCETILGSKHKVNPFPNKLWFLCVCSASLLKTLWEKEKLLVTSNFSTVFSTYNTSNLDESKICRLGRG